MTAINGTNGDDDRHGTDGADSFSMKDGDDKADGWAGADEMHGGSGADTLNGGEGADTLYGEGGYDVLRGGEGRDVLIGGAGPDQLYGGAGDDRFQFNSTTIDDGEGSSQSIDTIHDFTHNSDKIDVSAIDANHNVAGNQAFRFIGEQAFDGHAGEINYVRYDTNGSDPGGVVTMIQFDVDGDRQSDLTVVVDGNYTMTSGDFVL